MYKTRGLLYLARANVVACLDVVLRLNCHSLCCHA